MDLCRAGKDGSTGLKDVLREAFKDRFEEEERARRRQRERAAKIQEL